MLLVCIVLGAAVFSIWLYRRDTGGLSRPVATALLAFRLLALFGLVLFFAGPEKRSETRITKPSRLAVVVDTSLSMNLSSEMKELDGQAFGKRIDLVHALLGKSQLLEQLNRDHELLLYRFGDQPRPELLGVSQRASESDAGNAKADKMELKPGHRLATAKSMGWVGAICLLFAVLFLVSFRFAEKSMPIVSCSLLGIGLLALPLGVFLFGLADVWVSRVSILQTMKWTDTPVSLVDSALPSAVEEAHKEEPLDLESIDLQKEIVPRGVATRIGSAIQQVVDSERGNALAGIVLLTDGQNNQGVSLNRAIASANDANVPVYALGIGDTKPIRNVRVSEIEAPPRVIPGDKFQVAGIVQAFRFEGQPLQVRLSRTNEDAPGSRELIDEVTVIAAGDGVPVKVEFEMRQDGEVKWRYLLQVVPPTDDADESDNKMSTVVQSIQRESRVMLIAGGPTRDYQFLRNQLFRDENIELDVWLQLARPGADQEADNLIFEFPDLANELDQYDCIIGFDPDWTLLTARQAELLEQWVSRKAGGMVLIAGPVFTPEWTRRPRGDQVIDRVRGLYPVSFYSQGTAALKLGRFGGEEAFPLEFTRIGRTSNHLWLGQDGMAQSIANWESFPGVYGYYAVNERKAGAEILARFSDPATKIEGELPIYLASHYYGAGRVFFQASGEIWRLRRSNVNFFRDYYLNVIRWASEGRLLRDNSRGVLLVDRNRCWVGDQITVRAILRDAADQPLMQQQVNVNLRGPDGDATGIVLENLQDLAQPGSFVGQFVARSEGEYELTLPVSLEKDEGTLRAKVQASIPDLEMVNPERNDMWLQQLVDRTGGVYCYDLKANGESTLQRSAEISTFNIVTPDAGLASLIGKVDQETFLPGAPEELFARKVACWLFGWIVLLLCMEWIVRRLHKLA